MDKETKTNGAKNAELAAGVAAAGVLFVFVFFRFIYPSVSWIPACAFHSITGYHCPGCGGLRAMHALANGRLIEAAGHNALFVLLLLPLGAISAGLWFFRNATGREASRRWPTAAGWSLVVIVILFGILRNLPCFPFNILAP